MANGNTLKHFLFGSSSPFQTPRDNSRLLLNHNKRLPRRPKKGIKRHRRLLSLRSSPPPSSSPSTVLRLPKLKLKLRSPASHFTSLRAPAPPAEHWRRIPGTARAPLHQLHCVLSSCGYSSWAYTQNCFHIPNPLLTSEVENWELSRFFKESTPYWFASEKFSSQQQQKHCSVFRIPNMEELTRKNLITLRILINLRSDLSSASGRALMTSSKKLDIFGFRIS